MTIDTRNRWLGLLRETFETIVLALFIFFVAQIGVQNYQVLGPSMEPNLHQGQYLLVNKIEYKVHPPTRGDIIVFQPPDDPHGIPLIKRVIGLPGETVEVRDRQTFVNGVLLHEPYIQYPASQNYAATVVPADAVFVLGDNRANSSDSRSWGPLPTTYIIGRALLCYWPPERVGILPGYSYAQP